MRLFLMIMWIGIFSVGSAIHAVSSVWQQFETLDASGNRDGVIALWKENAVDVMVMIHGYLDETLPHSKSKSVSDRDKIKICQQRVMRAALTAAEALNLPAIKTYVASALAWDDTQVPIYRERQRLLKVAHNYSPRHDFVRALTAGRQAEQHPRRIGDQVGLVWVLNSIVTVHNATVHY